ncbi:alginate export family protein [Myxococcus stipitatus]|uniref:alginate export family protein n=1 Tax=Myxococcus stipitatus TaxID=83455 RepID=UPI003144E457
MLRGSRSACLLLLFGVLAVSRGSRAEDGPSPRVAPRDAASHPPEDGTEPSLRPDEDPFDRVKNIPLGEQVSLSLGGQHRLRYELTEGLAGPMPESVLFSRNLLHVDAHAGPFRAFIQWGGHYALGAPPRDEPPGSDLFDVQQAFVEWAATFRDVQFVARVGRQEMALGSTRWVGIRDGTNVRQAFDIARLTLTGADWSVEGFGGGRALARTWRPRRCAVGTASVLGRPRDRGGPAG